jgi:hypothetical protein
MTRKHFKMMAADIASMANRADAKVAADAFAAIARASNPRFDSGRFYAACGL